MDTPIRLIEHSESFEVRYGDGREPRFFYFEDEPIRRQLMGRMTRAGCHGGRQGVCAS